MNSGKSLSFEKYVFSDKLARYVKITVNGNILNNYASISEIRALIPSSSLSQVQCVDGHIQNAKAYPSQTGFPSTNAFDDNLDTRRSNNGVGSWIQLIWDQLTRFAMSVLHGLRETKGKIIL